MADPKQISEEPLSMVELKEELNRIKKRDDELSFRASRMEDYLNIFAKDKADSSREMEEKLQGLEIPRLKDNHIKKIGDIRPKTLEQLKFVLDGYSLTVNQENMKKIFDVLEQQE